MSEQVSQNTQALIDLLRERDAKGLVKYGVSLDRTDLTQEQWIQHAIEELLDGAAYLQGLKRGFEEVRKAQEGEQVKTPVNVQCPGCAELTKISIPPLADGSFIGWRCPCGWDAEIRIEFYPFDEQRAAKAAATGGAK